MKFYAPISYYFLFVWTSCQNELPQSVQIQHRQAIHIAVERAATATTDSIAIQILTNCLKSLPKLMQQDTPADLLWHKLGVYYYLLSGNAPTYAAQQQYADQSILHYNQAISVRAKRFGDHWLTQKSRLNTGIVYAFDKSDLVTSQKYLESALITPNTNIQGMSIQEPLLGATILYNLGILLKKLGDYPLAAQYSLQSDSLFTVLNVLQQADDSNDFQNYINNLLNLGDVYASLNDINRFKYYQKITNLSLKRNIPKDIRYGAAINQGIAHRQRGQWKVAEKYLNQAQSLCDIKRDSVNIAIERAKCFLEGKQFKKAEWYALNALNQSSDYPKGHIVLTEIYTVLGQIYLKTNELQKARKAYENALGDNTDFQNLHNGWQIEALSGLADLQSQTAPETASKTYETLSDVLYRRKSYLKTDAAKLNLTQQARQIFAKSISLNRQLHEKTNNLYYLDRILTDMERSKAVLLSEVIQDSRIKQYRGIPNALHEQERALRFAIAQAERQNSSSGNFPDLSAIYQKWNIFVQHLKQNYPKYYDLKHDVSKNYTIQSVQKHLPNETGLIHYYLTDKDLHILSVDKSSAKAYQIPITATYDTMYVRYQRCISQKDWDWKQNVFFSNAAHQLYQYLLEKPLSDFKTNCKTLLIIPDEKLASFSFGALFTAADTLDEQHNEPYLIRKYAINMAYTLEESGIFVKKESPKAKYAYAGFSHDFDFKTVSKGKLLYSKPHLDIVHKLFLNNGKTHLNPKMNLADFKDIAPTSRITELVSHGGFYKSHLQEIGIAFPIPNEDRLEWLDIASIYNMDWSANELLALIACETGKGQPVTGETIMSMAYSFAYSGSKRRISALWSIPHRHSMEIMDSFFEALSQKKNSALALQVAQVHFLDADKATAEKTPNLWAGLALSGDLRHF